MRVSPKKKPKDGERTSQHHQVAGLCSGEGSQRHISSAQSERNMTHVIMFGATINLCSDFNSYSRLPAPRFVSSAGTRAHLSPSQTRFNQSHPNRQFHDEEGEWGRHCNHQLGGAALMIFDCLKLSLGFRHVLPVKLSLQKCIRAYVMYSL